MWDDHDSLPRSTPGPYRVHLPTSRVWASWVLLAINIVLFVVTYGVSFLLESDPFCQPNPYNCALFVLGWKQNELIFQGQYWRLLTAMFLHGGLVHLLFNGFALYMLGKESEKLYGTGRFLVIYFLAGLTGSIASYAFSSSPSVGASGAIFGLIGAVGVFFYLARKVLGEAGRQELKQIVAVIAINLVIGFSFGGIIDNYAHIGGLIGGAVLGWLLAPRYVAGNTVLAPAQGDIYPTLLLERRFLPLGWVGAIGILLMLGTLAVIIQPPLPV